MNIATTIALPVIPPLDPALFVDVDMFGVDVTATSNSGSLAWKR